MVIPFALLIKGSTEGTAASHSKVTEEAVLSVSGGPVWPDLAPSLTLCSAELKSAPAVQSGSQEWWH